jgi:hypothetical protein
VSEDADEKVSPSLETLSREGIGGGGEVVVDEEEEEEEEEFFLSLSLSLSSITSTIISVFISLLSIILSLLFSISFSFFTSSSSILFAFCSSFPFSFSSPSFMSIFSLTVLSDISVVKNVDVKDVAVDENIIVPSTTPSSSTSINGVLVLLLVLESSTGTRRGAVTAVGEGITGTGVGYTVECTVELTVEFTAEFMVEFTVELGVKTLGYVQGSGTEVGDDNDVEGDFNEYNDVLRGDKGPFLSNPLANSLLVTAGKYKGGKMSFTITIFCSSFCTDGVTDRGELCLLPFDALTNSLLVTAGKKRGGTMSFIITNFCSFSFTYPRDSNFGPLECEDGIWFWVRDVFCRSVTYCVVVDLVRDCIGDCECVGDDCDSVECDSRLGDREGE